MSSTVDLKRSYSPNGNGAAALLYGIFGDNAYYAMAQERAGEITYQPVRKPLTEPILKDHLTGKMTLGAYQLSPSNTVRWLGWDVDSVDRAVAREYTVKITSHLKDVPHVVEFSGSKGYHILIFLSEPMPAEKAKVIVDTIRDAEGLPASGKSHVECYPKQAVLTRSQPYGSLLKIPLGVHPRTHDRSRFVDPLNGWEAGQELEPIELLSETVSPDQLFKLLESPSDPQTQLVEMLKPYWLPGERHHIALYLSGYLAQVGWIQQDVIDLVLKLAEATGDTDVENRMTSVRDTFEGAVQGKKVKGLSGLSERIPQAVLQRMMEAASRVTTPPLLRQIDSVRLSKGPTIEKVRIVTRLVWTTLRERGELIQTPTGTLYWYESTTHQLWSLDSVRWEAILHRDYGINPRDPFCQQVIKALSLQALNEARTVEVKSRTVWDKNKLLINLGGGEVYVLDGDTISTSYNGECGYMFLTTGANGSAMKPDWSHPVDVWQMLIADLSFSRSANVPASPEEQGELLKAWILSYFFQELMPTRPLLIALGQSGSGKTTALRRMLRILESPDSEVMELVADKPDALRASLSTHHFIVLDNLEKTQAPWLVDMLNRLSTGAAMELRQLYKTNEIYSLKPNVFIGLTAVNLPFSEETLFSRLLPLELAQLISPLPEYWMQQQLKDSTGGIWADLMLKLNKVVAVLRDNDDHLSPISSRLADFSVFCKRIESCTEVINGKLLLNGLRNLVDHQRMVLMASSPFIVVLEDWLATDPEEAVKLHTWRELYRTLEPLARQRKLAWRWTSAEALARHISMLADNLKRLYNAEFADHPTEGMLGVKFKRNN